MNAKSRFACQLAKFLRLNGAKVISGTCKLSLTTAALCMLNSLFDDIQSNEGHECDGIVDVERLLEDLQFLKDFFKKTSTLKVFHGLETLRGGVDLSRFSNLKVIELFKVPAHLILGLDCLNSQLKALICHRSICFLKEIFQKYGSDGNSKRVWTELKELNVAYNCLEGFDNSLFLLPKLEYIDASHNYLKFIDEIQVLEHLVYLNLSYNRLETVPLLSGLSSCCLKVLFLRNNGLEDLIGLDVLTHLEELDVRYNCLSEHSALAPLRKLSMLNSLQLDGNPLFCHKKHRQLTLKHIHQVSVATGFLLDGKALTKSEISIVSQRPRPTINGLLNVHQTSINVIIEDVENIRARNNPEFKVLRPSVCSNEISIFSPKESQLKCYDDEGEVERRMRKRRRKKVPKEKHVDIRNMESGDAEELPHEILDVIEDKISPDLPVHIQTKQLLEIRRKEYKEGWLVPTSTFQTLSTEEEHLEVPPNTPACSNQIAFKPREIDDVKKKLTTVCDVVSQRTKVSPIQQNVGDVVIETVSSSPCDANEFEHSLNVGLSDVLNTSERRFSEVSDGIEVLETVTNGQEALEQPLYDMSKSTHSAFSSENAGSSDSDSDCEDKLFVVDRKDEDELLPMFVKLGEVFIKELNPQSARVIDQLDLRSLVSVNIEKCHGEDEDSEKQELHLAFDTTKVNRQKRIYVFYDSESIQEIFSALKPLADTKNFQDITTGALQCLKCYSQFSKKAASRIVVKAKNPFTTTEYSALPMASKDFVKEADSCPNCGSTVVVEIEELPLPLVKLPESPGTHSFLSSGTSSHKRDTPGEGSTSSKSSATKNFSFFKRLTQPLQKQVVNLNVPTKEMNSEIKNPVLNSVVPSNVSSREDSPQIQRKCSDVSTQSSIAVISDTESNIDTIVESLVSPMISPLPNLPMEYHSSLILSTSTLIGFDTPLSNASVASSNRRMDSDIDDFKSITESVEGNKNHSDEECQICPNISHDHNSNPVCQNENVDFVNLLQHKEQYDGEIFTSIDHRLKLLLDVIVLSSTETLEACIETSIIPSHTGEEFKGLLVISSTKLYILKDMNHEYSLDKPVKPVHTFPLGQIKNVCVILGNQAITMMCQKKTFTFLLRDADLCNCFLSHFEDIIQSRIDEKQRPTFTSETDSFLAQIKTDIINPQSDCEDIPDIVFHMLAYWNSEDTITNICVVVLPEDIFVSKLLFNKIKPNKDTMLFQSVPLEKQKIGNLISIQLTTDLLGVIMCFEDEKSNISQWNIRTQTKSSLLSFIGNLKAPWESMFVIELPLQYVITES